MPHALRSIIATGLASLLAAAIIAPAALACDEVLSPADFSGQESIITFDGPEPDIDPGEIPFTPFTPPGTLVSDQFAAKGEGVTFEFIDEFGNVVTEDEFGDPLLPMVFQDSFPTGNTNYRQFGPGGPNALYNSADGGAMFYDMKVSFGSPVTRFAFEARTTFDDDLQVTVMCVDSNNTVVAETTQFVTDARYLFLGLCSPNGFDHAILHVVRYVDPDFPDPETGTLILDNLRYERDGVDACWPADAGRPLEQRVVANGELRLSVDGVGFLATPTGTIQVEKFNSSSVVRSAWLAAASTPYGDGPGSGPIERGDIVLNGVPLPVPDAVWERQYNHVPFPLAPNSPFIHSGWVSNVWTDVTSIVKPVVDAAGGPFPKRVNFTVQELCRYCPTTQQANIDGSILAVIFDDPNKNTTDTVVLWFGSMPTTGGTFSMDYDAPLVTKNLTMEMGLGISFGFQPSTPKQYTQVGINAPLDNTTEILTTSAGGQDDRSDVTPCQVPTDCDGSLITVGGLDDTNANPSPLVEPGGFRTDDERYNLLPYVKPNDTKLRVYTANTSSHDDNLFFAWVMMNRAANDNERPVCNVSQPVFTATADSSGRATVTITGVTASDPDGDALTITWSAPGITFTNGNTLSPTASFPIGATNATVSISDGKEVTCCEVTVIVNRGPICDAGNYLCPPNHKMRTVEIVVARDELPCLDPDQVVAHRTIQARLSSSEPDEVRGNGDGNTTGDTDGANGYPSGPIRNLTFDFARQEWVYVAQFRAERQGTGKGRSYCAELLPQPCPLGGDTGRGICCVLVPHDQRLQQR